MSHHTAYTLGLVTIAGGLYAAKKSPPSLAAGLVFGGLFLSSGYMIQKNKDFGIELALGTSATLFGLIMPRAIKTKLPIPLSLMGIGLTGSLYYGRKLYQQQYGV